MAVAHGAEYAPESSLTVTLPPPVNDGSSLTAVTVRVNVCGDEVSEPPFAVPPLSDSVTVTVALPNAFAAVVKVSTPLGESAGCTEKSALLSLLVLNETLCPLSSAGP